MAGTTRSRSASGWAAVLVLVLWAGGIVVLAGGPEQVSRGAPGWLGQSAVLSLPRVVLPEPTVPVPGAVIPAGAGRLVLPDAQRRRVDSVADLPAADHELVGRRTATGEVWANPDGSETIKLHSEPIHFRPAGTQAWERIDNTVIADPVRPGWVRNNANDWTVWFGPITAGGMGGVEIVTGAGTARLAPETTGARQIVPRVGSGSRSDTVTYDDVWPGVDVRYRVLGGRVKEDIVVAGGGRADYPFVVEGLALSADPLGGARPGTLAVTGAQAGVLTLAPVRVFGSDGEFAGAAAKPGLRVEAVAAAVVKQARAQRLVVSVDAGWLASQAAGDRPVVVDPDVIIGASALQVFQYQHSSGTELPPCGCGVVMTGRFGDDSFRTIGQYPYFPYLQGKQLESAAVLVGNQSKGQQYPDGEWYEQEVSLWQASGWGFHLAGGAWNEYFDKVDDAITTGSASFDVTNRLFWWMVAGKQDGLLGFEGDHDDAGSIAQFDSQVLLMKVNTPPPAPALLSPAQGALSITGNAPTLDWATVADSDPLEQVNYVASIATGTDGESGLVATSPKSPADVWQVPDGVLQDGVTYYWKVYATDGKAWTPSEVRKLTVDRRMGAGGLSPADSFGGVSTNLVTGNAALSVAAPDMPSIGGGVGVDFVYNAQQSRQGLVGTYREDVDKDRVIEGSDPVKLVRTDASVAFDWTRYEPGPQGLVPISDAPSPGVPADWYSARWQGFVTTPSGDWRLGLRSDDGKRLFLDGHLLVDDWRDGPMGEVRWDVARPGKRYSIAIEYYEAEGGAGVELWAQKQNATGWDTEFRVPSSWLSPDARELPSGWSLVAADTNVAYARAQVTEGSVTLTGVDGASYSFAKSGDGYKAPDGIEDMVVVNASGSVTVHDDAGSTYSFRPDGALASVTTALDDRKPAAAQPSYDSQGRLGSLTDPVSGRTVTLVYADQDNDGDCPNAHPVWGAQYESKRYMLCKVVNWDGTATELYYGKASGSLGYIRNPGDVSWGFGYDATGKLIEFHDPIAYDAVYGPNPARTDGNKVLTKVAYTTPLPGSTTARVGTITLPPALQGDTLQMARTYSYAPGIGADGMITGGTATVTRAGAAGTFRLAEYDARGRGIKETNTLGQTSTTWWNNDDLQVAVQGPDGLVSTTSYDSRKRPTTGFGPAPADKFDWPAGVPAPKPAAIGVSIPQTATAYDEGIDGLQSMWWNNASWDGSPVLHQHNPGAVDETFPAGSFPPNTVGAGPISARFMGEIVFPTGGTYQLRLCLAAGDIARVYINEQLVQSMWTPFAADCNDLSTQLGWVSTWGGAQRIRIDYQDYEGDAGLGLAWKLLPDGPLEVVPAAALKPAYGLATSTVDPDGKRTETKYTDPTAGIGPHHGLAVQTIVDPVTPTNPAGLSLTETIGYETAGSGFLRRTSRTLPAGIDTKTTNVYYDSPGLDVDGVAGVDIDRNNPCVTGEPEINQGGRLKLDRSADPDGTGPQTAIIRENVYDKSGRVVATRIGAEPWTCTKYDIRGRATEVKYPAFGGSPARTVTNNYKVDPDGTGPHAASPMVTSVNDAAGTITVETDLLGRVVSYKDVFANTTTFTYDQAGRETSNTGPVGLVTKTYDNADRITSISRNSQVLAEGFVYHPASGRLTNVAYPTGTGKAGNGTAGTFNYDTYGRISKVTWTGPAGLITSDEIDLRSIGGDVVSNRFDGGNHHAGADYLYDKAGRLTQAWVPGAPVRHLTYEYAATTSGCGTSALTAAGKDTNRTKQIIEGGATTTYCYNKADRLISSSDPTVGTLVYDSHGNTTTIFGQTHTYDAADRHTTTAKTVDAVTTTVAYVRDATDRIVERKLNGATVARYGSTGSGDAPEFTANTANQVQEVTFGLPGGAMLTTRAAGNVWSYPNIHGDVTAIANQIGAKQGATMTYDPYGNQTTGTIADNSAGDLDYGWLGQHQRPLEHQTTAQTALQPIVEMGARQYSPLLGRFLEVDPVEGGSANDYDYVKGDGVNNLDLDGNQVCADRGRSNCFVFRKGWRVVKMIVPRRTRHYASLDTSVRPDGRRTPAPANPRRRTPPRSKPRSSCLLCIEIGGDNVGGFGLASLLTASDNTEQIGPIRYSPKCVKQGGVWALAGVLGGGMGGGLGGGFGGCISTSSDL